MRKLLLISTLCIVIISQRLPAQNPIHGRNPGNGGLGQTSSFTNGTNSSGTSGTGANIDVIYHKIFWRISPDSATKYIKGYVQTNFKTIVANVTSITFDMNQVLVVDSVRFRGAKLAAGNITHASNIITITLGATLANNFIDSLTIYYGGPPPAVDVPPGAVGYQKTSDAGAGNYIYTLSESYEDRDWWPCKADMQDKIDSMDITVSVPWASPTAVDTFWVACNGVLTDSTISGNSRYFTFKTRHPIASYLVSVCVARFSRYYRTQNVNGTNVPVTYNLFKGKSAGTYNNMLLKLDSMNLALQAFSNKLSDYHFKDEKHGFYEFGFSGGMEHQTFSGISTGSMTSATILAHELMHQWFGDNVSFSTWNDLWLAEGFAAYGETTLYYETVANHPTSAFFLRSGKKTSALGENANSAWIPDASCNTSSLWNSIYGSTIYDRGCMVVSMLRAIAGDTKFYQALTNYQNGRAGKSATTDTLKNYFNAILGQDISQFFTDYVGGSGPGAAATGGVGNPIINMNWNSVAASNHLTVQVASQTRSSGSNVAYFHGPVVMHFTNAASGWTKDTTIVIYDWGGATPSLSYAGNGLSAAIPGNILNYDLSFTPTNAFYDDSARTLSTGSITKVGTLMGYTWSGTTSSAWNTSTNWASCCSVPPSGAQVTIATTGSQPVLPGTITVGALTLNAGTKLNIGTNNLIINGAVTGTGTITGSTTSSITVNSNAGTLNFDQTSAATRSLNNLIISSGASATLGSALDVYGAVTLTAASLDLAGKAVTLKSNSSGTASIANLTGSTLTGATNVTMERYIPANASRAWRLLAAPTTGQTIHQAWQENQAAGATTPAGNGVQITTSGATWAANGFDFQSGNASMLTYLPATNTWTGISSTANAIASTSGYFVYVRGDRTCTPGNSTIALTTLRSTGTIYQGTQTALTVNSGQYALVGNIYPSTIDFRNVTRAGNTDAVFYVWDPKLTGTFGYGAYQTCTLSGGNYVITPGGGSYGASGSTSNTIQSGAAFFVHATGGAGTVQLTETCKTTGSAVVFKQDAGPGEQLVTNMYAVTGTGNNLADGVLTLYDAANSNNVDGYDAQKITNLGENIGMRREGQLLAVEQRQPIGITDTIFYNTTRLRQQDYQFEFIATALDHPGLSGKLIDNYLGNSTPVDLNGTTTVTFTVNTDPASADPARFMIVFATAGPLPVSFTSIKAYQQDVNIAVEWKVANQLNIQKYEVEKSMDGFNFSKVGTQSSIATNGADATYNWLDVNAVTGDNFYRIRSVGISGETKLSQVVDVKIAAKAIPSITVYPNPVTNKVLGVQFTGMDKGIYQMKLVNTAGQVLLKQQLMHTGGSASVTLALDNIGSGTYYLEIIKPDNTKMVRLVNIAR